MRAALIPLIGPLAHVAVWLVAFAVGLAASQRSVVRLWHDRPLLARSLLATLLVVPLATIALARVLPLSADVRGGLVVMVLSIGPVAAIKQSRARGGDASYALALSELLLVISIVYVPLAVAILGALFRREIHIGAGQVALAVLERQLLPLAAGLLLARYAAPLTARLVGPATLLGNVLLGLLAAVVVVAGAGRMVALGVPALLAIALVAAVAVALGHLLGGPAPETRMVLATFSALRFPVLALLLAKAIPGGQRMIPVMLAYLLASVLLLAVYGAVTRGVTRPSGAAPVSPPLPSAA
jgi:BASS family bile acid:Na+ symporter